MIEIENIIVEKYGLEPDAARHFIGQMDLVKVRRNAHIIEKGGFNDNFYFIREGILRAYIPTEGGEQTLWFGYPGQAIFDVW